MKKIVALVLSLVMVLGLATTAFAAADTYDLYKADANLTVKLATDGAELKDKTIDEFAAKAYADGSGYVDYLKISGEYWVKTTTPTVADYAVTAADKTDILFYVTNIGSTNAEACYEATAKSFADFGTSCGQLYQVDKTKVYYEITAAAVASVFEKGDVVAGVLATASHKNVLVDGKIVSVATAAVAENDTLTVDTLVAHNWAVTGVTYSATLGNVPTEVKCLNCGAVVTTFYYGSSKVPAGETGVALDAPYGDWYFVEPEVADAPAVVAPEADAADKVESADTFDAGIAMYVGMSVMAAAGSAVVLKKKD